MARVAGVPERDRQVGRADQDRIDSVDGEDLARTGHGDRVLDLNDDDRLRLGPREVLGHRDGAMAAGSSREREPAPTPRRVVRGREHRFGLGCRGDVRHHDPRRARVERLEDP